MKFLVALIWMVVDLLNFSPFLIDGPSMEPTLRSGQIIMIDEEAADKGLARGDVVVFALEREPGYYYVKRIIGLPGEKIHIRKDGLYVDKENSEVFKLEEPYLSDDADSVPVSEGYRENYQHTYDIPEGNYFVLGDNRLHSLDSRYFNSPFIKRTDIIGKYLFNISDV